MHKRVDRPTALRGDLLHYTVLFGVAGRGHAPNLLLYDKIPEGTSFVSGSAGHVVVNNTVMWRLGDRVSPYHGSVHYQLRVNSPTGERTHIRNIAYLSDDCGKKVRSSAMSVVDIPELGTWLLLTTGLAVVGVYGGRCRRRRDSRIAARR